jgi:glycosyltransferase involved in cell wall biosynthesis
MSKKILLDFEKIKDPFCGLGQFCSHLKTHFEKSSLPIEYFTPNKYQKIARKLPLFLPHSNVFHGVHQDSPYMPPSKKTKYVLTIHDLNAFYEKSKYGTGEKYLKKLQKKINRADYITFISEFTKSEVLKHLDLAQKKTAVIYNGISLKGFAETPEYVPSKNYLFSIGTVLPKKNFHVLIDFLKTIPDLEIVIAGTTYHQYAKEMIQTIKNENLQDRFHLVGTISENQKIWYYSHAQGFIFPSLLEGFGLPVAEAMSFGLPLFLSRSTSLPEIGGPDAYYFDHFSPEHMNKVYIDGILTFTADKKSRLIERSSLFDWQKAANNYLQIYKELL